MPSKSRRTPGANPKYTGRKPTPYDPQIGMMVLEEMAKGEKSLKAICKDNDFPDRSIIYRWVLESPEFAIKFAIARDIQQHSHADEIIYLADNGKIEDEKKTKMQISVRQWAAARLLPKFYGEQINLDHTATVQTQNAGDVLSRLTPEERMQLRDILKKAADREPPALENTPLPGLLGR